MNNDNKIMGEVSSVYNSIAGEFDNSRNYAWNEFEMLEKHLPKEAFLIDVGCGNGRLVQFLRERGFRGKYIGFDNAQNLLSLATENFPTEEFRVGDLMSLELEDKSVDFVAAIASFHHLPSVKTREKSLNEFYRVLKDGGLLYITAWNLLNQLKYKKYVKKAFWRSLISGYKSRDLFIPWGNEKIPRYYYAFKLDELKGLLLHAGFEIVEESIGHNFVFICRKVQK